MTLARSYSTACASQPHSRYEGLRPEVLSNVRQHRVLMRGRDRVHAVRVHHANPRR